MSLLTPSQVILRHKNIFLEKKVFIAGHVQGFLPELIHAKSVQVHTAWYHHYQTLSRILPDKRAVQFGLIVNSVMVAGCDTLIYVWPKNKSEALFQLTNLLSLLPLGSDIFIVGENSSGIRSTEKILQACCSVNKIDNARHCKLYHGKLMQHLYFNIEHFWKTYKVNDVIIKTLPGVFSRDKLDNGSQLLLSTFHQPIQGHVADIGCGSGILSAILAKNVSGVQLTLIDVHAPALVASRATLTANHIKGAILAGDMYSSIRGHFDMILSNPSFHDGKKINLNMSKVLIRDARKYLRIGGELRIVANAFLPYPDLLDRAFGTHHVLAENRFFKVYQTFHKVNSSS